MIEHNGYKAGSTNLAFVIYLDFASQIFYN